MTERAKPSSDVMEMNRGIVRGIWCAGAALLAGGACSPAGPRPVASYDRTTRQLVRLATDLNGDGRVDQWTYMAGPRPLRAEVDADGDGRIERWEYFGDSGVLQVIGTSSAGDGVEDMWSWAADEGGERRVDVSRGRDRVVDRREFYRGETLVRAEEDGNLDGLADKWEIFEDGRLAEVRLDTTRRTGRPDRRLRYDAAGEFAGLEMDADGTGRFVPVDRGARP